MPIRTVEIPEEHQDRIDKLIEKERALRMTFSLLAEQILDAHDDTWKYIKEAIPELKEVEASLRYDSKKKEVWYID